MYQRVRDRGVSHDYDERSRGDFRKWTHVGPRVVRRAKNSIDEMEIITIDQDHWRFDTSRRFHYSSPVIYMYLPNEE